MFFAFLVRRREDMVGVNMVLAEFIEFKHGLYKSCGIMLEPCLLQPCFHVARKFVRGLTEPTLAVLRSGCKNIWFIYIYIYICK